MSNKKIGTFFGVIVPNITMMFGVILFLRLGVVTAHAGLWMTLGVLAFGLLIMLLTSASIAAIASNMEVGAGGVYYLLTRSLGIEVGGAFGYAIYIAQILTISLTTTGFAYTMVEMYPQLDLMWVEVGTLLSLMAISSFSTSAALKLQGVILFVLVCSIGSVFFGSAEGLPTPSPEPFYEGGTLGFWVAFALIYPALTGIEAGMALSGNLKDPSRSLMAGNAISLIFAAIAYGSLVVFAFYAIPMDSLRSDPFAFVDFANPSWLVLVGICTATLSSALGGLLGAPRILQSMAKDSIVHPVFAKGYGSQNEPFWSLVLTTALALVITLFSSIDQIIPMLTLICLFSYGLLNVIAGLSALMNAPSWVPRFKMHHSISWLGALLCIMTMFMISTGWSIVVIFFVLLLYVILRRKAPAAKFNDLRNSILFFISRLALYRLSHSVENALTWHPKVLVLTRLTPKYEQVMLFAQCLTRQSGLLSFVTIVPDAWSNPAKLISTRQALEAYFRKENIECLIEVQAAENEHEAFFHMVRTYGIGQIQPNTIIMPMRQDDALAPLLVKTNYQCYLSRKNVILLDEKAREDFISVKEDNTKRIDLWWNSKARTSLDLMFGFVMILSSNPDWEGVEISLKALAPTEQARVSLQAYLEQFIRSIRVEASVIVYCQEEFNEEKPFTLTHSKEASLIMMPIMAMDEATTFGPYEDYLNALLLLESEVPCAYICCYDNTEHCEIYLDPLQVGK